MILEGAGSKLGLMQGEVGRGPGVGRALRRSGGPPGLLLVLGGWWGCRWAVREMLELVHW